MKKLGAITIGQSPRVDVTPEMLPFLTEFQVVEKGALDGLGPEELAALAPKPGENVLPVSGAGGSAEGLPGTRGGQA
ncbi:AroM family protein [Brevibacillus borstelensis]|uniref:AroM family protein n=1 Tax=Brevibacillus borstelensis TaxID=45462 RepID=UPI001562679D|nr:AroM family protein [Brevibacillus borstelensis]MBE5397345.1 AroM family protein [Brevibacillus borstelensis]